MSEAPGYACVPERMACAGCELIGDSLLCSVLWRVRLEKPNA